MGSRGLKYAAGTGSDQGFSEMDAQPGTELAGLKTGELRKRARAARPAEVNPRLPESVYGPRIHRPAAPNIPANWISHRTHRHLTRVDLARVDHSKLFFCRQTGRPMMGSFV
jgi:hypothetical protein